MTKVGNLKKKMNLTEGISICTEKRKLGVPFCKIKASVHH